MMSRRRPPPRSRPTAKQWRRTRKLAVIPAERKRGPESITTKRAIVLPPSDIERAVVMDSGLAATRRPGMTEALAPAAIPIHRLRRSDSWGIDAAGGPRRHGAPVAEPAPPPPPPRL